MNPNMMQIIQSAKRSTNPQSMIAGLLRQQCKGNHLLEGLINSAEQGNKEEIMAFARNSFKEQGRDFDKEFGDFMNSLK